MRAGIQSNLILIDAPGFPFDFAQGGESFDFAQDREPVEPRVSPEILGLARNDSFFELRHRLLGEGNLKRYDSSMS
jgi:hypothetical protein